MRESIIGEGKMKEIIKKNWETGFIIFRVILLFANAIIAVIESINGEWGRATFSLCVVILLAISLK